MARWTPARSRPGTGRSRGKVAPPARTTASNSARRDSPDTTATSGAQAAPGPRRWPGSDPGADGAPVSGTPTAVAQRNSTPSARSWRETAVEHGLLHLELGDPVAQQSTGSLGPLVDHDPVPGPCQLLGARQAGGPRPHHGHGLAGAGRRDLGGDPTLTPTPLGDLVLDALDGHRIGVDAEHARPLARRRTEAPGELGEVVGGVQPFQGLGPVAPVHEVVPFRDEIPERAPFVAERDAAVHAARPLADDLVLGERLVDLAPVPQPDGHGAARRQRPAEFDEAGGLAHDRSLLLARARRAARP